MQWLSCRLSQTLPALVSRQEIQTWPFINAAIICLILLAFEFYHQNEKEGGEEEGSSMILPYLWILLSTAAWDQTKIKQCKGTWKFDTPLLHLLFLRAGSLLFPFQHIHVVCCSQGFCLIFFPSFKVSWVCIEYSMLLWDPSRIASCFG